MTQNKYDESITDLIAQKIGVERFIVDLYPHAKARGRSITLCCPFHSEKNPSLAIYRDSGRGKCFGCGKTTDLVDLYAAKYGLSNSEACKQILQEIGV